jgi:Flp pilus assembly pilin Flp
MFTALRAILFNLGSYTLSPADALRRDRGQTMAEYAVVLALIVVVTVATFTVLGDSIEAAITAVRTALFP